MAACSEVIGVSVHYNCSTRECALHRKIQGDEQREQIEKNLKQGVQDMVYDPCLSHCAYLPLNLIFNQLKLLARHPKFMMIMQYINIYS